mmetsp:Transcript_53817/g.99483  ORF Transcript_53817/g.99483 Transcript_53817/m.99483 type:complete len:443 (-) Transcript_53817:43-1371(-)
MHASDATSGMEGDQEPQSSSAAHRTSEMEADRDWVMCTPTGSDDNGDNASPPWMSAAPFEKLSQEQQLLRLQHQLLHVQKVQEVQQRDVQELQRQVEQLQPPQQLVGAGAAEGSAAQRRHRPGSYERRRKAERKKTMYEGAESAQIDGASALDEVENSRCTLDELREGTSADAIKEAMSEALMAGIDQLEAVKDSIKTTEAHLGARIQAVEESLAMKEERSAMQQREIEGRVQAATEAMIPKESFTEIQGRVELLSQAVKEETRALRADANAIYGRIHQIYQANLFDAVAFGLGSFMAIFNSEGTLLHCGLYSRKIGEAGGRNVMCSDEEAMHLGICTVLREAGLSTSPNSWALVVPKRDHALMSLHEWRHWLDMETHLYGCSSTKLRVTYELLFSLQWVGSEKGWSLDSPSHEALGQLQTLFNLWREGLCEKLEARHFVLV